MIFRKEKSFISLFISFCIDTTHKSSLLMFIFIINEHNELEVKFMKKIIIFLLIMMNLTSVCAVNETPRYKIIGSSYQQEDIDEMYKVKDQLLLNYKKWVKGVDDVYQVLADHQDDFNAKYYNGLYTIVLGEGKGKSLEGKLQVSYCTSSKEIKKKSWLIKMFS